MLSRLKPDSATTVGILTAAGVFLIYNNAMPNMTDLRMAPAHNPDVETARKHAAWMSAGLVGIVFLVARDFNSYIISGAALVGIDYLYKHNNGTNPGTGKLDVNTSGSIAPSMAEASSYPMPDYAGDTGASEY